LQDGRSLAVEYKGEHLMPGAEEKARSRGGVGFAQRRALHISDADGSRFLGNQQGR